MNKGKFEFIMCIIVQTLCDNIKNYFNIEYKEARNLLYNSKLYKSLEREETKIWYFSTYELFRMFLEERETGTYTVYEG